MTHEEFVETLQDWRDEVEHSACELEVGKRSAFMKINNQHTDMLAYVDSLRSENARIKQENSLWVPRLT